MLFCYCERSETRERNFIVEIIKERIGQRRMKPWKKNHDASSCSSVDYAGMAPYIFERDLGSGNFGITKLFRNVENDQRVAVKLIRRGEKTIDNNVMRYRSIEF